MLEPSDLAPAFTLPRDGGGEISLSDLKGQVVVLFFYPRDDTPGCTKESIGFSEHLQAFAEAGAAVFGVSRDTVAKHDKFVAKHGLTVPLLSDAESTMCEDYGVWVEKNMYGRKYMGMERTTYLVAEDGTIAQVWRKVKVKGHAEAVLEAALAL